MIFSTELNQHWTDFSWTTAEMHHFRNNLYCVKHNINKGDLTWVWLQRLFDAWHLHRLKLLKCLYATASYITCGCDEVDLTSMCVCVYRRDGLPSACLTSAHFPWVTSCPRPRIPLSSGWCHGSFPLQPMEHKHLAIRS